MAVDNNASEKTRDCAKALAAAGVAVPKVLLPGPCADWARWAVIACDQYTSSRAYWQGVSEFVGPAASALRLVLPELYLDSGFDGRVREIHEAMREYVRLGALRCAGEG
ncbi:MAG: DUF1015 domain-containing protein, partial [Clostridiales bacterium]|nr:DUF1015 domain-containing protein [Clostridiales bacterium]